MNTGLTLLKAAAIAVAFSASAAYASLQAGVAVTGEYDSNVLPDPDLETETAAAWGQRWSAYAGLSGAWPESLQWQARYDISRSHWADVEGFDSTMQSGFLRVSRNGRWSPELSVLAADAHVDGADFLQLLRVSPATGYLISRHWYTRMQLDLSRKTFLDYPDRDSDQWYARGMLYWLLDKTRRYVSVQLGAKHEDASNDLYSYRALTGRLRWKHTFGPIRWDLSARMEQRDYEEIRAALGEPRKDQRLRLSTGIECPLGKGFSISAEAGRDIYHSNLDVADYSQNRAEVSLSWDY